MPKKMYALLRRYTDLSAAIKVLETGSITFLNPDSWDDRNDAYFMNLYRQAKDVESVLAICCSTVTETYHGWKVFGPGSGGVCITYKKRPLLLAIEKQLDGVRSGPVLYKKIKKLGASLPNVDQLPFLKRAPYEPESEFRIIYESKSKLSSLDVPIPYSCIDHIYLSPWSAEAVAKSVQNVLKRIDGCAHIPITRSTLIKNDEWQRYGDMVVAKTAKV